MKVPASASLLMSLYEALLEHFGPQRWWPAASPWEVCVGAVLTQNTNWQNVEKAITRLKGHGLLEAATICALSHERLADCLRPAGYFNVKARRLRHVARWWLEVGSRSGQQDADPEQLRGSLLGVHGVGPETADSILLYALQIPRFVVDAYTRRALLRHQLVDSDTAYDEIQALFESALASDTALYNEYHALFVALGKHYCRPCARCAQCPWRWHAHVVP